MSDDIGFEFVRPLWLLGLLALPIFAWIWHRVQGATGWENYIATEKLRYLSMATHSERSLFRPIVIAGLALAITALAGPSWRAIPLPVKQPRHAVVIAFDLSPSMLGTDISPDRLTRARLKIIDLLRLRREGETALIAYADDAYRVSPLTDDTATIEALIPSLHPNVMPGPGSQVEAAVQMAHELLEGASIEGGLVLIVTDGIAPAAMEPIEDALGDSLDLCILGVGSDDGVPIPLPGGGFARDSKNQTILAGLNSNELANLASRNGGCYTRLQSDDADLEMIMAATALDVGDDMDEIESTFDVRQDEGHWIVLLLLPAALLTFRRNVFWFALLVSQSIFWAPSPSQAIEWKDLWERADQQQVREMEAGAEAYRAGDYASAAERFRGESSLQLYNRGNALALDGQLEEALESYDQALAIRPDYSDAEFNREVVEKRLEEQENQDSSQGEEDDSGSEEQNNEPNSSPEESDASSDSEPQQDQSESPESNPSKPTDSSESEANQEQEEKAEAESQSESERNDQETPSEDHREDEAEPSEEEESSRSAETEQEPLSDQSEQWLRNIPDDPGGLMRRKFQYQAEQRRQGGARRPKDNRY